MVDLDLIKSKLTPSDVFSRLGYALPKGKGDARCPKHDGVSLRLRDDQGLWHCFGCNVGGDIISLHTWLTGADFKDAVRELADWAGVTIQLAPDDVRKLQQRRQVEDLLAWAADWYAARYAGSVAEAYAKSRTIEAPDARLGYAPDAWDDLTQALDAAGIDLRQAEAAGLIKQRGQSATFYDVLRHRLIVPNYSRGRCVYLQGRALAGGQTDDGTTKFKNTALAEPPLYHLNGALSGKHTPILSESTTDTLRLTVAGLPGVSTYGAALKDGQLAQLRRLDRLYLAIHNDAAGGRFADNVAGALGEAVRIAPPPEGYKDWDEALTAGQPWAADENLTWLRWRLRSIAADTDPIKLKEVLEPLLSYLVDLDEAALSTIYLNEMAKHFSWPRDLQRAYEKTIKERRADRTKASQDARRVKSDDSGQRIDVIPDPVYINASQTYRDGVVYIARKVARKVTQIDKLGNATIYDVHRPAIITSDRRLLIPPEPKRDAPIGAVTYLNDERTLAMTKPLNNATDRWSYEGYTAHLDGRAPDVAPHVIYDQLLASIRQYVYHNAPGDYVIDVLWCMGTYFHQQFDAFPYLAVSGHKGSGKTTLLHWLSFVAFNALHIVNTSEASLYRMVEALAPTMLIDEQEGMNSRNAAKDGPLAALMGILKSGYQKGTTVTRQDPDAPAITQEFNVYSPKAMAAVAAFEDILADRAILVYMPKVTGATLKREQIRPRGLMHDGEFAPLRDNLYLLLMQHSDALTTIRQRAQSEHGARFGELAFPLICMAALVDLSRGDRTTLNALDAALAQQEQHRAERNDLTPEAMLTEAVRLVVADAIPADGRPKPEKYAQLLPDGCVVMDAIHISDAFGALFSGRKDSFFNDQWLGNQVARTDYIDKYRPPGHTAKAAYRWERIISERSERTGDIEPMRKLLSVYIVMPTALDGL